MPAPTPYYAVWEVTLACNLKCVHCGSRAGKPRPRELTTEEALRVADELADLGVQEVTLIGGEAYLRPDWDRIIKRLADRGVRPSIATGARGFTRERAVRGRDAGLTTLSISVDGLEETHDRLRGVDGSWRTAMDAFDLCRDVGLRFTANTQVNRASYPELDELCGLLLDKGIQGWQVQITVAMGNAADRPVLLLQPTDVLEVIPKIAALKSRCLERGAILTPGNNVGYFGPHESLLRSTPGRPVHWEGCTAGRTTIGIESDGTFKGCPSLMTAPYTAGNLLEQSARAIWEDSAKMREHRAFSKSDLWGRCGDCYYAEVCRAGCTWTSHALLGRAGNNPYCYHRAETLKAQGLRERLVPSKPAPGVPFDSGLFELVEEPWQDDPTTWEERRAKAMGASTSTFAI